MDDLRYPIGKFQFHGPATEEQRYEWMADIAEASAHLREAVNGLSAEQLDTPYRPGAGPCARSCIICPTAISMRTRGSAWP